MLIRSGAAIKALLDDLVDFNRTRLGLGIKIEIEETDLAPLFTDEIVQHRIVHPECRLDLKLDGDLTGQWDGARLQPVLRNLLANAVAYCTRGEPVRVTARGDDGSVRIDVANHGPVIDPETAKHIFDPLKRGAAPARHRAGQEGLGLGLYIVREIARSHGGSVGLRSDSEETIFSVSLPRNSAAPDALRAT